MEGLTETMKGDKPSWSDVYSLTQFYMEYVFPETKEKV